MTNDEKEENAKRADDEVDEEDYMSRQSKDSEYESVSHISSLTVLVLTRPHLPGCTMSQPSMVVHQPWPVFLFGNGHVCVFVTPQASFFTTCAVPADPYLRATNIILEPPASSSWSSLAGYLSGNAAQRVVAPQPQHLPSSLANAPSATPSTAWRMTPKPPTSYSSSWLVVYISAQRALAP